METVNPPMHAAPRRKVIQCFICWKVSGLSVVQDFYKLQCRHYICSLRCLKTHLKSFQEYTGQIGVAMCTAPNCSSQLSQHDCEALFQGQFQAWLHKQEDKARPRIDCAICQEQVLVDEAVTLECDHRYCRQCTSRMLESAIQEGQNRGLQCPDCQHEIDVNIIRGTVDESLYERYINQALRSWQPPKGEFWFDCPTPDCPFRVLSAPNIHQVQCPLCKHKFCPRCRRAPHRGSTCEAFAKWQEENGQGDARFRQLAQQQRWRQCPHCHAMVEKTQGCDHMVCYSPACRGVRAFCYICGKDWNGHVRCG